MARRKTPDELEKAEIRYRSLVEKRDVYNDQAAAVREERDLLRRERDGHVARMKEARDRRRTLLDGVKEHKGKRNALQARAKELIDMRRKIRDGLRANVPREADRVRREIEDLDTEQQTTALTLPQENRLLDELKALRAELKELERLGVEYGAKVKEDRDLDAQIDYLFKEADKEHEQVVKLSEQATALKATMDEAFHEASRLDAEAEKKHAAFAKVKERADEYHEKAVELRSKVIQLRREAGAEEREARAILREHGRAVDRKMLTQERKEEAAEAALQALLKKGKVEL